MATRRANGVESEAEPNRRAPSEADRGATEAPLLSGRYRYAGELGRGTTGRVIALLDRAEVPRVAKVLEAAVGAQAQWELDALLAAQSPHLVSAVELLRASEPIGAPFSVPSGAWILVESRASGEPSSAVIGAIAEEERRGARVLAATAGVLRALGALHGRGLSHGDVKPENVLLEGEHATLVDLGAAAPFGRATALSGTLAYMAPEAREGERSVATDLYSVGATVVSWVTGAPPGSEPWALPAWIPPPLEEATRSMLAERIADRPRDTDDVLRMLGREARALPRTTPARPPLVGMDITVEHLVDALDARGWVVVAGPSGSGRSRLVEEAARAIQRREARAGREAPTYLRTDRWPRALVASTFVHLEGDDDDDLDAARRLLAEGRITGHAHRVVLERSDERDCDARHLVRASALEPDEARSLLAMLLGEAPSALVLRAAFDATAGLAGRLVRGVESLTAMGLEPRRAEDWRLVSSMPRGAHPTLAAQRVLSLSAALGGTLELAAAPADASFAEGARWLVRRGWASFDASGALTLHREARSAPEAGLTTEARARALRDAASLPLTGWSRLALEAHRARDAPDRGALQLARELRERGRPEEVVDRLERYLSVSDASTSAPTDSDARMADARARLHVALADALRASGQLELAARALEARPALASFAAAKLLRAELARLAGDVELAVSSARALESDPVVGEDARALLARTLVGRDAAQSRALADSLLDASAPSAVVRAHEVLALGALAERRATELLDHTRRGLDAASRVEPAHARRAAEARLVSLAAQGLALEGRLAEARARHTRSAQLAHAAADRLLEATFDVNEGLAALDHGDLGVALASLERGARMLHRLGRRRELARALTNLANAHGLVGDDARARTLLEEASSALEGVDDADAQDLLAIVRSELLVHRGKLRAASSALESSVAPTSSVRTIVRARLASALAAAGELERAHAVLATAEPSSDPRIDAELALAHARLALAHRDLGQARARIERALQHAHGERVGFELRTRALALDVELEESSGHRGQARAALGRLRAELEPALRSLPIELQSRFRQIPGYRRALAEGALPSRELASTAERALDGLAVLASEPRLEQLDDRLAEIALTLASAERAFVVEWTEAGLVVRGRAGTARADVHARPSSAIALRALREHLVTSTDAVHERDASSSVHALALRSVLAVELSPRLAGAGPRVLVVDDPLRAGAFDAGIVAGMRALTEVAGPLLSARIEARRARQRERRAERREAALEADARRLRASEPDEAGPDPFASFVHEEPSTTRLIDEARRLASSELPLLLVGETGVGKDLLARAIHRASPRRHEPFVSERGGDLAGSLADAALFGHVRGAFTGAEGSRKGLFELADRGTLLLDGLEDIPLEAQAKLLRILVEGEVRPLGGSRPRRVDVRVLATTKHPPHESIARGVLRADLYYRVAGAVLVIPPLRERPRDLDALVTRALARSGREVVLSARARSALHARRWPGNVRELEHALTEALLHAAGSVLDLAALGSAIAPPTSEPTADPTQRRAASLHEQRVALTRELVLATLEAHQGNRTHAARALGLSRFGLQKMLRRFAQTQTGAQDEK